MAARLDNAREHEHELVGGMRVDRDDCSFREASFMDRTVLHGLRQWQQFDAG
jgi:hypothetical protein